MYLSDLRVYFKVQVYFRVTKEDGGVLKLVDYANTTNVKFIVDPKVLFHGSLPEIRDKMAVARAH